MPPDRRNQIIGARVDTVEAYISQQQPTYLGILSRTSAQRSEEVAVTVSANALSGAQDEQIEHTALASRAHPSRFICLCN